LKSTNQSNKINILILPIALIMFSCLSTLQAAPPWEQTHKLLEPGGGITHYFGHSVAISGNLAVIGSPVNATQETPGSAYLFDVTTGEELIELSALDGTAGDQFGSSVAISGNIAVIGALDPFASGSAYVFDVTTGQQLFKLLRNDGSVSDGFGASVAVSGNFAVVGAFRDDDNGPDSGAAYVFDVTTGQQLFKLHTVDGAAWDEFGLSVAINGTLAVIGADQDDDNGTDSGSAYVFDVTTGQQLFKMIASDGAGGDSFGRSVAIDGNTAVIGSVGGDGNVADSGSAYVFDINTGQQLFKMLAIDGEAGDFFGSSVAIDGDLAVIGAFGDGDNGFQSGSAYIFQQQPANHLSVSPDPLIANQDGTFTITQALPNALTGLIYSTDGLQNTFIRQLNVVINIANPKLTVNPRSTDANGDLQYILPMPFVVNPIDVWFQAVQFGNVTNFEPTQLVP